jgi:hypothetical protein
MSSMRYVKNQSVGHFLIHGHVLKMALVVVCCVSESKFDVPHEVDNTLHYLTDELCSWAQ